MVTNKELIKCAYSIKDELEEIQQYCIEEKDYKNKHVKMKISLMYSIIEFLETGGVFDHKALSDSYELFKDGSTYRKKIEDLKSMQGFTSKVRQECFMNITHWRMFSHHPSREIPNKAFIKGLRKELYRYAKDKEENLERNLKEATKNISKYTKGLFNSIKEGK